MALTLQLPSANRQLAPYRLRGTAPVRPAAPAKFNRIAYSAAHVVADPLAAIDPWLQCAVDWDATIAYRRHLWSLGLGVAEAMDTAQRGMGLDWPTSLELIRRSSTPRATCRVRWSHRAAAPTICALEQRQASVDQVVAAYEEQMAAIEKLGGKLIVMASRALAQRRARSGRLRARVRPHPRPGTPARDPALAGRHVRSGAGRLLGQP